MWPKHGFARCWHFLHLPRTHSSFMCKTRLCDRPTCLYASNSSSSALPLTPIASFQLLSLFYFASPSCQIFLHIFLFSKHASKYAIFYHRQSQQPSTSMYYRWNGGSSSYGLTRLSTLETRLPLLKSHFKAWNYSRRSVWAISLLFWSPLWPLRLFPLDLGRLQE